MLMSSDLLNCLLDDENWEYKKKVQSISVFEKDVCGYKMIKIKKEISISRDEVYKVIKNIENYSQVLTAKNVYSEYVDSKNDTLYGYQKYYVDFIPFTRNRQLVFKMYEKTKNNLIWEALDQNHYYLDKYSTGDVKTLTKGAGSWEFISNNNKNFLVHRFYMDTELNIPEFLLSGPRENSVLQIFSDVLLEAKNS